VPIIVFFLIRQKINAEFDKFTRFTERDLKDIRRTSTETQDDESAPSPAEISRPMAEIDEDEEHHLDNLAQIGAVYWRDSDMSASVASPNSSTSPADGLVLRLKRIFVNVEVYDKKKGQFETMTTIERKGHPNNVIQQIRTWKEFQEWYEVLLSQGANDLPDPIGMQRGDNHVADAERLQKFANAILRVPILQSDGRNAYLIPESRETARFLGYERHEWSGRYQPPAEIPEEDEGSLHKSDSQRVKGVVKGVGGAIKKAVTFGKDTV